MNNIYIQNIHKLYQVREKEETVVIGNQMNNVPLIENAYIVLSSNNKILDFGKMSDFDSSKIKNQDIVFDAKGRIVIPTFCDSHTHLIFAKYRELEFVDRIKGLSYEQIGLKGGGILNSAKYLNQMPEDELLEVSLQRLDEVMKLGTGSIEIKSGYGLTVEGELKMLRVIQKLKKIRNISIKSTFLAAHAYPAEYKKNHNAYIQKIIYEMLPIIKNENLADFIDVFIEKNYFSIEEALKILNAGEQIGLKPKVHVNQFNTFGGVELCINKNATSVDHLEKMSESDFSALQKSKTIATLLPSCSFFLNIPYAPARKFIERNIPFNLASDFNPGSTPSGNMKFVMTLACIYQKCTPNEAFNAVTINGAYALEEKKCGTITKGKNASVIISNPMNSLDFIPYSFGHDFIDSVIINGKIIKKGNSFVV